MPGDNVFIPEHDYIIVAGDVLTPSRMVMDKPLRVSEAIKLAGGVSQYAVSVVITQCRQARDGHPVGTIVIGLKTLYKTRSKDIYLNADDIVYVKTSRPAFAGPPLSCPRRSNNDADLPLRVWH